MLNKIHFGDCRISLRAMAAAGVKVQTCVTSPPYFGLRDYGHAGQIGLEPTPEQFIAELVEVFRCVRDVLADDGTLFINIGDSYYRNPKKGGSGPGGKNETKWGYGSANSQRAAACGTSDKEPANSPASDCLCGSLCDACRKAYRIGKSRSGGSPAPMPALSPCASSREHKESAHGRLPTSDSTRQDDRTAGAIQDQPPVLQSPLGGSHDALASTIGESSLRLPDECSLEPHLAGECLLCERSLQHCAPLSERMEGCNCDTSQSASASGSRGMGVLGLACPNSTTGALKEKDLIGIPWMLAFALRSDGWYLRQEIIWHKPNPMPESVTDRCTKAHEQIFLLSKSPRYYFDAEAIKEDAVRGHAGSTFNKGKTAEHQLGRSSEADRVDDGKRNRRSVWSVATKPYKGAHFATFPPALIEPCILAGSRPGDVVLDPFMGSGTTAEVAILHGRQFVGCELNDTYAPLQDERIAEAFRVVADRERQPDMFEAAA